MFVRPDPPEELESQQAHIVALQSDLSKQFLIAEQQIKEIDGLKGELSRAKRYSAALATESQGVKGVQWQAEEGKSRNERHHQLAGQSM